MVNRIIPNKRALISWNEDWFYTNPLFGTYILSKSITYSFEIKEHWTGHLILIVKKVCGKKNKENKKVLELSTSYFLKKDFLSPLKNQYVVKFEAKKWLQNELNIEAEEEVCRSCLKESVEPWNGERNCKACIEKNRLLEY